MDEEGEGEAKVLRDGITRGNVRCMQPRREKEREERVGRSVARGSWRKEEGKGTSDRSLADELRPWAANREKIEGPPSSTISSIPSFFPFNSLLLPPPLLPCFTMAPPPSKGKKRAAEDSSKPSKKSKPTTDKAPVQPQQPRTIPTTATQGPPTLPYKSSLVQDDVDFPRGGGSALTPFEFKEATNEARKEADADARVEVSSTRFLSSTLAVRNSKSN